MILTDGIKIRFRDSQGICKTRNHVITKFGNLYMLEQIKIIFSLET